MEHKPGGGKRAVALLITFLKKAEKKDSLKAFGFGFTSTSRKSWSFLHVAEKVSEVPNSKYHSLFLVLENKQNTSSCKEAEKKANRRVFFTSRPLNAERTV